MAQFARPAADSDAGQWTSAPLWSKVDEGAPGDSTLITSDNNSDDSAFFTTTSVADPGVTTGHILRARWAKSALDGHAVQGRLSLYQGDPNASGVLIVQLLDNSLTDVLETSTLTLSGAEVGAITDYSDLHLRLRRTGSTGGNPNTRRSLLVEFIELEIPDATTVINGASSIPGSGSLSATGATRQLASASATSAGALSAEGGVTQHASATISGMGDATGDALVRVPASANVPGAGSVTGTLTEATGAVSGAAIITGQAGLFGAPLVTMFSDGAFNGTSAVSGAGLVVSPGASSLDGVGSVIAIGASRQIAAAVLSGQGALSGTGTGGVAVVNTARRGGLMSSPGNLM